MTSTLITGIGELTTMDPEIGAGAEGIVHDAAVICVDGAIAWIGSGHHAPPSDNQIDLDGRALLPGFIDTHTHLTFAGSRVEECFARLSGETYDGSGIASTLRATRQASEEELRRTLHLRVKELRESGTATFEAKGGYSLDVSGEERLLRITSEVTPETTFLGAHVVPPEYVGNREEYLRLVTGEMLERCAPWARWADVFCEPHAASAFTGEESNELLSAFAAANLQLRVHAGQLGEGPGVALGITHRAASVDHLNYLSARDIDSLAQATAEGGPVATILPLVDLQSRGAYAPARQLIDAGVRVAIASDCNPGTNASSSLPLAMNLAVNLMRMTPTEALHGVTTHAAAALRREDVGAIRLGMAARFTVVDAANSTHIFYRPGVKLASALILDEAPTHNTRSEYRW